MAKKKKEEPDNCKQDETTIRASCTRDENRAIKRIAKMHGVTVDTLVKEAVESRITQLTGKKLSDLVESIRNEGKLIQGTLF